MLAACALIAACAPLPRGPQQVLDARTGASLLVVSSPIVLARERRDVAVRARDYLTLVAAESDESGQRRLVLVAHRWSTIDTRAAGTPGADDRRLLLVADGRDFALTPLPAESSAPFLESAAVFRPTRALAETSVYLVDRATLAFLGSSHSLGASFPESALTLPFSPWLDGRAALTEFLEGLGPS